MKKKKKKPYSKIFKHLGLTLGIIGLLGLGGCSVLVSEPVAVGPVYQPAPVYYYPAPVYRPVYIYHGRCR